MAVEYIELPVVDGTVTHEDEDGDVVVLDADELQRQIDEEDCQQLAVASWSFISNGSEKGDQSPYECIHCDEIDIDEIDIDDVPIDEDEVIEIDETIDEMDDDGVIEDNCSGYSSVPMCLLAAQQEYRNRIFTARSR